MTAKRGALILICICAGLGVLAAGAATLSGAGYDVQGDADLPYESGNVKEVRVFDSVTVYVDDETRPYIGDLIGMALLILATAACMTAIVLHMSGRRGRLVTFYALVGAGLGFAAVDELLAIHETLGHNLRFLADIPGVTRPDDVIVALYIPFALVFIYYFRDIILSNRRAAQALAAALGFFVLAAIADTAGSITIEAVLEGCSGLCLAAFLPLLIHTHLRRNLRPHLESEDEVTVVDQRAEQRAPAGVAP